MTYWCEHAWLPGGVEPSVVVECGDDGAIEAVAPGPSPPGATVLGGLVLSGFANVHSHAFQRALRGRTDTGAGTFWTWREQMIRLAARLEPASYLALARAVYGEMALAGIVCVGEFHYVHHRPDGSRYDDPNAMGHALRQAARDAGVRLTLVDACYLTNGIGAPLGQGQRRFGDGTVERWARRVAELAPDETTRIGVALHSVRAVPAGDIPTVVEAAGDRPLHAHVSEQPAENAACLAAYGTTPVGLLHERGALGPATTAVHATHLTGDDVERLGASGAHVCFCPTTERDLADGIGPARALAAAGASLCVGSDQHVQIDVLEEARALEMDERLARGERGAFSPAALVDAMTWRGHRALGWPEAGRIAAGAPCDLVALRLDSVRTAGAAVEQASLAASAADVSDVIVGGRPVVRDGRHLLLGDVAGLLAETIAGLRG